MTVCNMAIEAGRPHVGMVAVDDTTLDYVRGKPYAPLGQHVGASPRPPGATCTATTMTRCSIPGGRTARARIFKPQVTWGTSPEMVLAGGCQRVARSRQM